MLTTDIAYDLDALDSLQYTYKILDFISVENTQRLFSLHTFYSIYEPSTIFNFSSNSLYEPYNLKNLIFISSSFFNSSEFITTALIYNFMQLLILGIVSELVWPTQFFNSKFQYFNKIRINNIVDVFLYHINQKQKFFLK